MLTEDAVIGSVCDYLVAYGRKIVSPPMANQRCTDVVAARVGICRGPRKLRPQYARLDHGSDDRLPVSRDVGLALSPSGTLGRG